jgi:hypothetical protein
MNRKSDFISEFRGGVDRFLKAMDELRALRHEYDALDYGNSITDPDFAGSNEGVTRQGLLDAVSSVAAVDTLLGQGHATNLYRVRE